jgi:hypothetical protein
MAKSVASYPGGLRRAEYAAFLQWREDWNDVDRHAQERVAATRGDMIREHGLFQTRVRALSGHWAVNRFPCVGPHALVKAVNDAAFRARGLGVEERKAMRRTLNSMRNELNSGVPDSWRAIIAAERTHVQEAAWNRPDVPAGPPPAWLQRSLLVATAAWLLAAACAH